MTPKQKIIVEFCLSNNNACTKKDAMNLIDTHYCNGEKHVGEVLSRMVKAGILVRIKPGYFKLGTGVKKVKNVHNPNQTNLF